MYVRMHMPMQMLMHKKTNEQKRFGVVWGGKDSMIVCNRNKGEATALRHLSSKPLKVI